MSGCRRWRRLVQARAAGAQRRLRHSVSSPRDATVIATRSFMSAALHRHKDGWHFKHVRVAPNGHSSSITPTHPTSFSNSSLSRRASLNSLLGWLRSFSTRPTRRCS